MRYASSQYCICRCKCIYVTAPPVSSSGPIAPRMRILLFAASGATKAPQFTSWPLTSPHKQTFANVLIQTAARQRCQAQKNIWPLCKNQPFKLCTQSVFIFLPQIFFFILCLLFVQACSSSQETGCAIGTEFKDDKEGQKESWLRCWWEG